MRCLSRLSGWGVDPVVALHLRNAADYRLPTFGPHGTKLWLSWCQWLTKSDFSGWSDNSIKEKLSGHCRWIWGWSRGCTPPMECCRLPPTYFWTTWHQTRAFLISVNNKKWFFGLVWQFWKRRGVWADWIIKVIFLAGLTILKKVRCLGRLSWWGVDPVVALHLRNAADYRLPTFRPHGTKLGHPWYQW